MTNIIIINNFYKIEINIEEFDEIKLLYINIVNLKTNNIFELKSGYLFDKYFNIYN